MCPVTVMQSTFPISIQVEAWRTMYRPCGLVSLKSLHLFLGLTLAQRTKQIIQSGVTVIVKCKSYQIPVCNLAEMCWAQNNIHCNV